jgi:hypothetical protein
MLVDSMPTSSSTRVNAAAALDDDGGRAAFGPGDQRARQNDPPYEICITADFSGPM